MPRGLMSIKRGIHQRKLGGVGSFGKGVGRWKIGGKLGKRVFEEMVSEE